MIDTRLPDSQQVAVKHLFLGVGKERLELHLLYR